MTMSSTVSSSAPIPSGVAEPDEMARTDDPITPARGSARDDRAAALHAEHEQLRRVAAGDRVAQLPQPGPVVADAGAAVAVPVAGDRDAAAGERHRAVRAPGPVAAEDGPGP